MRSLLLAAVALVLITGCEAGDEQAAQGPAALEGTPWMLVDGLDVDGWEDVAPSASFAGGTLSGSSGCNRYSTSYTLDGDALELGPLVGTKMACAPPADRVEAAYRAALERAATWRVADDELTLLDADGGELLRFRAASPAGAWKATSFLQADAVSSPLAGTEITATFGDEGELTGSAGCNRYRASYTVEQGKLTITQPAATETACVSPAGVMEQEQAYLRALPLAAGYSVQGSTLTLLTEPGTIVATYTRVQG